jgi:hypothetical protein
VGLFRLSIFSPRQSKFLCVLPLKVSWWISVFMRLTVKEGGFRVAESTPSLSREAEAPAVVAVTTIICRSALAASAPNRHDPQTTRCLRLLHPSFNKPLPAANLGRNSPAGDPCRPRRAPREQRPRPGVLLCPGASCQLPPAACTGNQAVLDRYCV